MIWWPVTLKQALKEKKPSDRNQQINDAAIKLLLREGILGTVNEFREMKMQPSLERALKRKEILGAQGTR